MNQYRPQKYRWWELMFGRYKFARKLSKSYWVKIKSRGYSWVKMDKAYFKSLTFRPGTDFDIEDTHE